VYFASNVLQTKCCILKKIVLLHCLSLKLDITILYSLSEWNGYAIHVWVHLKLQNDSLACDLFSEKSLTQFMRAVQHSYPNLPMLTFCCLLPFISTYLCEQGWILGEENKKQSPWVPFFQRCQVPFGNFALGFCLVLFSVIDQIYFEMTKQIRPNRSQGLKR